MITSALRQVRSALLLGLFLLVTPGCARVTPTPTPLPPVPPTVTPPLGDIPPPTATGGEVPPAIETPAPEWTLVPLPTQETAGETPLPPTRPAGPAWQPQVNLATQDLAQRLNVAVEQIELLEVRAVVWPDASLGCPQPGMAYIQVQQDGLLIHLRVAGRTYQYHSGGNRPPFLCERPAKEIPAPPP